MSGRTFYTTTPIYYVNDVPHIGHAYATLSCDVMARFKRLDGYDVHFLTGTDEHGQKVEKAAEAAGLSPQAFTDKVSQSFRDLIGVMNFSPDGFIRTTEKRHYVACQALWERLVAAGDIYLGKYAGWYSVRDEAFTPRMKPKWVPTASVAPVRSATRSNGSRSRPTSSSSRPGPTGCSSSTTRTRASLRRKAGAMRSSAS